MKTSGRDAHVIGCQWSNTACRHPGTTWARAGLWAVRPPENTPAFEYASQTRAASDWELCCWQDADSERLLMRHALPNATSHVHVSHIVSVFACNAPCQRYQTPDCKGVLSAQVGHHSRFHVLCVCSHLDRCSEALRHRAPASLRVASPPRSVAVACVSSHRCGQLADPGGILTAFLAAKAGRASCALGSPPCVHLHAQQMRTASCDACMTVSTSGPQDL